MSKHGRIRTDPILAGKGSKATVVSKYRWEQKEKATGLWLNENKLNKPDEPPNACIKKSSLEKWFIKGVDINDSSITNASNMKFLVADGKKTTWKHVNPSGLLPLEAICGGAEHHGQYDAIYVGRDLETGEIGTIFTSDDAKWHFSANGAGAHVTEKFEVLCVN